MRCAWQAYINLLPMWMREPVDKQGREHLQELRLRLDLPPELVTQHGSGWLTRKISKDDLAYCVNAASRYSPWSVGSVASGYITALGGHRIGLCGSAVVADHSITGISTVSSVCIRVARDFPGIAKDAAAIDESILIIGKPGSGKTTLLRDLIRLKSEQGRGSIAVVDEKGELFPIAQDRMCFPAGKKTDVLSGCSKIQGIEMLLRNMGPDTIAVDEITAEADCQALVHAGWCGVKLLATAHAKDKLEFYSRAVYRPLISSGLFGALLVMQPDKSWVLERIHV